MSHFTDVGLEEDESDGISDNDSEDSSKTSMLSGSDESREETETSDMEKEENADYALSDDSFCGDELIDKEKRKSPTVDSDIPETDAMDNEDRKDQTEIRRKFG